MDIISELVLSCWKCGKQHSSNLYNEWLKDKRAYTCVCGGQVISNSGKVIMKAVVCNDKDTLINKKTRLDRHIKELEEDIDIKEKDLKVKYKILQTSKEELFITQKALDTIK